MIVVSAILVAAIAAPAAQRTQPLGARGESLMNRLQGFNIVLLVGEAQSSGGSIDDVPPAARRALNDMKDFLPFKHYRVLDSQWTSCCAESSSSRIAGRVQGVSAASTAEMRLIPRAYQFLLQVMAGASRLSVHFSLAPSAGSARPAQNTSLSAAREAELEKRLSDLRKELDTLEDEIPQRTQKLNRNHTEIQALQAQRRRVQQRIAETVKDLSAGRAHSDQQGHGIGALIDSSFTMDVGETVVVGTSRLGGDKALIAIVTAVRKGAASGR